MRARRWAFLVFGLALVQCTNNPYPEADEGVRVRYQALPSVIKTLDPAVSYSALEHAITAQVYETLFEYHYLKRQLDGSSRTLEIGRSEVWALQFHPGGKLLAVSDESGLTPWLRVSSPLLPPPPHAPRAIAAPRARKSDRNMG